MLGGKSPSHHRPVYIYVIVRSNRWNQLFRGAAPVPAETFAIRVTELSPPTTQLPSEKFLPANSPTSLSLAVALGGFFSNFLSLKTIGLRYHRKKKGGDEKTGEKGRKRKRCIYSRDIEKIENDSFGSTSAGR